MPLLHVQAGSADQLQDIADALWKARKVVVITGAGISTNSGIPDFRSKNGLYSMIQSQFDAASKLGIPKAEIPGAIDERPRKRRKTTPPIQDTIEVAHEHSADLGTSSGREAIVAVTDHIAPKIEASINVVPTETHAVADRLLACSAEKQDKGSEIPDAVDDEVVLLCEQSILAGEHPLSEDQDNHEDGGAKEEVQDPPDRTSGEDSESLGNKQHQSIQVTPQAASSVRSPRHLSRPAAQTTTSSPLSSPPPADLFDSFNEQSTDPPPSSTWPSSPVSTENGDEEDDDDDDNEPSLSQGYMNQPSFRRSLSTLKGKELFDASIWADPLKTSVFYTFATNLRQKSRDADPTGCHQFISHLSKAGKMVRCYTQNIDQLEDKVGLSTRLLLGAGSRSRFSTRTTKGPISANLGAAGPKEFTISNTEATAVPSAIRAGSPPQLGVDTSVVLQEITASNSQNAPSEHLEEVNVGDRRTSGADQTLVETCSSQNAEHGEEREQDSAKADAPPADVRSSILDKSMPGTGCATPTTPEHDRGVECVFLHGSLRALRCFQCGCVSDWEGARELQTMSGQQPPCPRCEDATNARQERGKRALGVGKLRPDIVLYGEDHPESQQISSIIQHDISLAPDMLIIMGTSLKVHGLKTVVREFAKTVHNRKDGKVIFVNYTKPAESVWADVIDFWVQMDCDSWVADLKNKKPIIWMPPGTVETDSRATTSKRRRTLADEADKKENKKLKKDESVVEVVITVPTKNAIKRSKPVKTAELPKPADAKPAVPKRPAAHRDCKHNAAYWTTKIIADLAKMTGRVLTPGPPPYRTAPATQNTALKIDAPAKETAASTKSRRGPRTKNTRSRKVNEAAVIPSLSEKKPTTKKEKPQEAAAVKAPLKRRTKSSGLTIASNLASGAGQVKDALLIKQDSETPDGSILVEVPVPNSGPPPVEDDLPMVSIVKNRIRKPKVFYGDSNPLLSAPVQRSASTGNARPRAQPRTAKTDQSEQTPNPEAFPNGAGDMHSIEEYRLPPLLQLRPRPPQSPITPTTQESASQTGSRRVIDHQPINTRRDSFFQVALAHPHSPDSAPPPEYLEPLVSPGPRDISPKMSPYYRHKPDVSPQLSPNHWQKFAFSYRNALHRSPFEDFNSLRSGSAGTLVHAHHQPVQHMTSSAGDPFLEAGPSIMPNLSVPTMVASRLAAGDSPDRQLQRETEDAEADAAATLLQMPYDPRHFAQV